MASGHRTDRNRREGLSGRKSLHCSSVEVEGDRLPASWARRNLLVGAHILRDLVVGRSLHGRVGRTRLFLVQDHTHHRKRL